jgi:hypothetical protein
MKAAGFFELERAGQRLIMSDERTVKKVYLGKPDGSRKARRAKLTL